MDNMVSPTAPLAPTTASFGNLCMFSIITSKQLSDFLCFPLSHLGAV
jgi:hypothetical protein